MTEYEDLSPYSYGDFPIPMLSVGWLGPSLGVQQGGLPGISPSSLAGVRKEMVRLRTLTLGVHECEFCPKVHTFKGNGEIHIFGDLGVTYSAPAMILHYIEDHNYVPPTQFIEAAGREGFLEWDDRAEILADIVSSPSQEPSWREDAAIDLCHWNDQRAIDALAVAGCDENVVDYSGRSIGISLAEMWLRSGDVDHGIYAGVLPQVQWGIYHALSGGIPRLSRVWLFHRKAMTTDFV